MSTVQGIVSQSGGHVGVQTEAGKGSAFHIYLPVAEMPAAQSSAVPVAAAMGGNETVLVQTSEAAEALRVCAGQPVDLLVTDIVMPKMSGVELTRRLRTNLPGLKAVYISGYSEDKHEREWASFERANFLQKPFTPEALAAKVREVMDGR